jgi:hypothetical protein
MSLQELWVRLDPAIHLEVQTQTPRPLLEEIYLVYLKVVHLKNETQTHRHLLEAYSAFNNAYLGNLRKINPVIKLVKLM